MSRSGFLRYVQQICATRVQFLTFVVAVWFTGNGFVGFMIDRQFPLHAGHSVYAATFHAYGVIPIAVNGWHASFHLITGVAGLLLARTRVGAIRYAAVSATVYWAMVIVCVFGPMSVCSIMAVDTLAHWVHGTEGLILAVIALIGVVYTATSVESRASWQAERERVS